LVDYRDHFAEIRASRASIVAVSVDPPARSEALRRELRLPFPILCDIYNPREIGDRPHSECRCRRAAGSSQALHPAYPRLLPRHPQYESPLTADLSETTSYPGDTSAAIDGQDQRLILVLKLPLNERTPMQPSLKQMLARSTVAVVLSAASLALPAAAQTIAGDPWSVASSNRPSIRIDNFARVDPHYYRGSQPHGRDYADLRQLGIKTVIDLTRDDNDATEKLSVANAGMKYVRIPMTTHQDPTPADISAFLATANDPANQPVYVHCVGGRHRTGVMTAIYRMTNDAWTADRAFAEMKQYKFGADLLHSEFKEFVYHYRPAPSPAAVAATVAAKPRG
jgi:tyrosine-protein phosphatase SIW14